MEQLIIHRIIISLHKLYVTTTFFFCFSEKASLFRSELYVPYTIEIMAVQFNSLCMSIPPLVLTADIFCMGCPPCCS